MNGASESDRDYCFTPGSGNTLKNIEKECCAKIMIRGKGSVKEGKVGRKDGQMLPGEDEPLHALVTANTMDNVKKAVEQVRVHPTCSYLTPKHSTVCQSNHPTTLSPQGLYWIYHMPVWGGLYLDVKGGLRCALLCRSVTS